VFPSERKVGEGSEGLFRFRFSLRDISVGCYVLRLSDCVGSSGRGVGFYVGIGFVCFFFFLSLNDALLAALPRYPFPLISPLSFGRDG